MTGALTSTCKRRRIDRTSTVHGSATTRQISHPGKYEPRTSTDGARSQPVTARHVNETANLILPLVLTGSRYEQSTIRRHVR